MVSNLALELHWTIDDIEKLYLDDLDYRGIFFWQNRIEEIHKKLDSK